MDAVEMTLPDILAPAASTGLGAQPLRIGGGADFGNAFYYKGELACIHIYNRTITSEEIQSLYTDGCSCFESHDFPHCSSKDGESLPFFEYEEVCYGHGDCVSDLVCDCNEYYFGENCNVTTCLGYYSNETNPYCKNCTAYEDCEGYLCEGYYGYQIDDVCSGNGFCFEDDNCTCNNNYTGNNCQTWSCFGKNNSDETNVCSGHGLCVFHDTCACEDYIGKDCSNWNCSGIVYNDTSVCSGHGECISPGICNCTNYRYSGVSCESWYCHSEEREWITACSNHGECIDVDMCNCTSEDYTGQTCQVWNCHGISSSSEEVCGGITRGKCVELNICECYEGYNQTDTPYGNCDLWYCGGIEKSNDTDPSNPICHGHGNCSESEKCTCFKNSLGSYYEGDLCETHSCFQIDESDDMVCSGHGKCFEPDRCDCDADNTDLHFGYFGWNCEIKVGKQIVRVTKGVLMLYFEAKEEYLKEYYGITSDEFRSYSSFNCSLLISFSNNDRLNSLFFGNNNCTLTSRDEFDVSSGSSMFLKIYLPPHLFTDERHEEVFMEELGELWDAEHTLMVLNEPQNIRFFPTLSEIGDGNEVEFGIYTLRSFSISEENKYNNNDRDRQEKPSPESHLCKSILLVSEICLSPYECHRSENPETDIFFRYYTVGYVPSSTSSKFHFAKIYYADESLCRSGSSFEEYKIFSTLSCYGSVDYNDNWVMYERCKDDLSSIFLESKLLYIFLGTTAPLILSFLCFVLVIVFCVVNSCLLCTRSFLRSVWCWPYDWFKVNNNEEEEKEEEKDELCNEEEDDDDDDDDYIKENSLEEKKTDEYCQKSSSDQGDVEIHHLDENEHLKDDDEELEESTSIQQQQEINNLIFEKEEEEEDNNNIISTDIGESSSSSSSSSSLENDSNQILEKKEVEEDDDQVSLEKIFKEMLIRDLLSSKNYNNDDEKEEEEQEEKSVSSSKILIEEKIEKNYQELLSELKMSLLSGDKKNRSSSSEKESGEYNYMERKKNKKGEDVTVLFTGKNTSRKVDTCRCLFCFLCCCGVCIQPIFLNFLKCCIMVLVILMKEGFSLWFASSEFLDSSDIDASNKHFILLTTIMELNQYVIWASIVLYLSVLTLLIIVYSNRFFIDPFLFCVSFGSLKEFVYFRVFKSLFLMWFICVNLFCYIVKYAYLDSFEREKQLKNEMFWFSIIFPETLLLFSLFQVLSYNGVSSHMYIKRLRRLGCCQGILKFPRVGIGFGMVGKDCDVILEDFFQLIYLLDRKELLERGKSVIDDFESSDEYGHMSWELVSELSVQEIIYLKEFFFPGSSSDSMKRGESYCTIFHHHRMLSKKWILSLLLFPVMCVFGM